ncbi:MAG TPA: tRNA pseudouridine(13) synthase TruD [Polyangiaceae bacterium]|nr:tRNA pseudouridine(13) synthase TruD [Polyangiaceae bacterium]
MSSDAPPAPRSPVELPFEHADLAPLGGRVGPDPEDFVVDEQPLYTASGQGDHWYVRLAKRERTTADLERAVADAAQVPEREVGYAGLKDKHAVTTQWLSVPVPHSVPPAEWQLAEPYRVLEITRHANKLRIGHLEGNRFRIRVVGLGPGARAAAPALCERIRQQGIGNYFGPQRFGLDQRNLETALSLLARRRLGPRAGQRGKFLASVIQSELFNRYLIARSELGRDRLLAGEVVRLQGSRAVFVIEDVEREAPRLAAGDIHLTGPIAGPKMKQPQGRPLELEREAAASVGLDEAGLRELGRSAPGTRRDLLLRPASLSWHFEEAGGEQALIVEFGLPAGAYASLVIRALTGQEFFRGDTPHPEPGADPAQEGEPREERSDEERTAEGVAHDQA